MPNFILSNIISGYLLIYTGSSGSVQLRSDTPEEGIVEYCTGGTWRAVCDSGWDYQDAFVVCRQLGFPATGMHAECGDQYTIYCPYIYIAIYRLHELEQIFILLFMTRSNCIQWNPS